MNVNLFGSKIVILHSFVEHLLYKTTGQNLIFTSLSFAAFQKVQDFRLKDKHIERSP